MLEGKCKCKPAFVVQAYNDTWCRDYGPLTLALGQSRQLLDFQFNGWGDKYAANLDNDINQALANCWSAPLTSLSLELEGGSIETDGLGTLLSTRHCLLESQRNRQYSEQQIESQVLDHLGLKRTLWLTHGALLGDDTDSHIDNLARFCDPTTIAYASCDNQADPHFQHLQAMADELQQFRTSQGAPYKLVAINIPEAQLDEKGNRLPASYINFLILNQSVLVPTFNCPQDEAALNQLQACFPNRKIVAVPGSNLIRQFGGPHCATMQLPKNTLNQTFINSLYKKSSI